MPTIADMPVHGGALPPALVEELPGDAILSRKSAGGKDCVRLRALRARCANNCVAACHLQGYADAKPRAAIILTVCGPVWKSYGYDYVHLKGPRAVKWKHINAARSGYDPEARKIFGIMADASFIGRALSSSDTVSIVPDSAYDDLRKQLQELHGNAAASNPNGGAPPPTAPSALTPAGGALPPAAGPKIVIRVSPYQIMAAERVPGAPHMAFDGGAGPPAG